MKVSGLLPASPARCELCDGWIVWAFTDSGRRVAVDAQLNIGGTLVLFFEVDGLGQPVGDPPRQRVTQAPRDHRGSRWISHQATCPKASAWRREQANRGAL